MPDVKNQLNQIRSLLEERQVSAAVQTTLEWFSGSEPLAVAGHLGVSLRPLAESGEGETLEAFLTQMASFIEPDVVEAIRLHIGEIQSADTAMGSENVIEGEADRLLLVTQERLGRECRDAIRMKSFDLAFDRAKSLLALKIGNQSITRRCQLLGTVLGSLDNNPKEAKHLWGMVEDQWATWKIPPELKKTVTDALEIRRTSAYNRRIDMSENEWTRMLTEAAMALRGELPPTSQLGEPTEEDYRKFFQVVKSLIESAITSPKQIAVADALWILVEYTPREQTETAKRAGIEAHIYNTLGPRARTVVDEAMTRLAQVEPILNAILAAAEKPPFARYRDMALSLMASIRWQGFAKSALKTLDEKKLVAHHPEAIVAVGACAGDEALETLCGILKTASRGKVIDGNERRLVIATFNAMGRVIQRSEVSDARLSGVVKRAIKCIPDDDSRLQLAIASRLCLSRIGDLEPTLREWAIERFIDALWRPDTTPDFARPTDVDQIRNRPLGQRQGVVNALIRVGPLALPYLHRFLMSDRARIGGAYVAVAEILGKIASPESVAPLEAMLRNALLSSDGELSSAYTEEQHFDAHAGRMVALEREHIVGSILAALRTIGSPAAIERLWHVRDQIADGHLPNFGREATEALSDLPPRRPVAEEAPPPLPGAEDVRASEPRPPVIEGPPTEELIADLGGGGFLGFGASKARVKRIAALQALAQRLDPEAIEPMIASLGDKDPMVRASARTALAAYAASSAPMPLRQTLASFVVDEICDGKSKSREGLLALLGDINTDAEPWAPRLQTLREGEPSGAIRAALAHIDRARGKVTGEESRPETPKGVVVDKIQLKSEYLAARRAWIAGGKQGPPPDPPEGLE
jgi:HEAT repeat protein